MMNIYYERTIDTIDDMLASNRKFMVASDTMFPVLLASDPRMKVKELGKNVHFYKHGTGLQGDQ